LILVKLNTSVIWLISRHTRRNDRWSRRYRVFEHSIHKRLFVNCIGKSLAHLCSVEGRLCVIKEQQISLQQWLPYEACQCLCNLLIGGGQVPYKVVLARSIGFESCGRVLDKEHVYFRQLRLITIVTGIGN